MYNLQAQTLIKLLKFYACKTRLTKFTSVISGLKKALFIALPASMNRLKKSQQNKTGHVTTDDKKQDDTQTSGR